MVTHVDRVPADAPVPVAAEAAQGGDPTAVAHHRHDDLVQKRRVDHAVDALGPHRAHPLHELRTALEHHVDAEPFDQVAVRLRGVGQDPEARRPGQLDHVPANGAGGAGDGQALARRQSQRVECSPRAQAIHRQGGGFGVGRSGRGAGDRPDRHDHPLGVGAVGPARHDDRHYVVTDGQLGRHTPADRLEHPSRVHPRHIRRGGPGQCAGPGAAAQDGVGGIDGRCPDPDADFPRSGLRRRDLEDPEPFWSAELGHADGPHPPPPTNRLDSTTGTGGPACPRSARSSPARAAGRGRQQAGPRRVDQSLAEERQEPERLFAQGHQPHHSQGGHRQFLGHPKGLDVPAKPVASRPNPTTRWRAPGQAAPAGPADSAGAGAFPPRTRAATRASSIATRSDNRSVSDLHLAAGSGVGRAPSRRRLLPSLCPPLDEATLLI